MVFSIDEIVEKSRRETSGADGVSFEEALNESRFGKFHYCLIFVSGIFMACVFYEIMGISYVLPVAECDLYITSKQQYGIVSGVWFAGYILASNLWGFVSDTYGRRNVLIIATLTAALGSALSSLAVNLWQLALFRFINGFCLSGTSTIFAYLGEFLDAKTRSRSTMISSVIFGGLSLFLPIMAMLVINQKWSFVIPMIQVTYKPWRLFIFVCGFPSLISGLSLLLFPESPKFTFSQGDETKTIDIFRRVYYVNTGNRDFKIKKIQPNDEFGQNRERKHALKMMLNQSVTLFRVYPWSIFLVSTIQFGMYFVCNGMLLFFPDIVNQAALYMQTSSSDQALCKIIEHAIDAKNNNSAVSADNVRECVQELDVTAYYYALILEGCYTGGFFLLSLLVNYVGRLSIFTFVSFSTGICGFLIVWVSNTTIAIYLYVWLLACGVTIVLLNTVTYDLFPTNLRALALSVSVMFGRLGALMGGNVAGLLLEKHCSALYMFSGGILIFTGVLIFLIPNIRQKK
ncbi:putative transporter SVOPL [Bradysia coprophila]|uniref:putative transporter SVOPL n=1 Tax=Bradysia coprophila TaxID=38358 RepID=UPI00187DD3F3|nr:putative transporter SVOPL [Bradysia coprophila]